METPAAKSLCILGRQPQLGLAELESLYGAPGIEPAGGFALLNLDAGQINFQRLGGTLKVARILTTLDFTDWPSIFRFLESSAPSHMRHQLGGTFTLGVSVYGLPLELGRLKRDLLRLKKAMRAGGRAVRIVPNKALELNSAQVLHNKLTRQGAWELLLVKHGRQTILAQTMFVQDIGAYAARDQARPKRDARVGMLPPKLAQIIVNLAIGNAFETEARNGKHQVTVLDPFCGTGVILQEALLMGYQAVGSDIEARMVKHTIENIEWLHKKTNYEGFFRRAVVADATADELPDITSIDAVASEVYLGRPLAKLPAGNDLRRIVQDSNTIIKKFLKNLAGQVSPGTPVCLAVPAWKKPNGGFVHLPLIDQITEMGYTYWDLKHVPRQDLVYHRPNQTVARQLIRLKRT